MHNLYQILGVNKDASILAIKNAFREKALSEHPDKGGDTQTMALLNEAHEVLSDPIKRKKFDEDWEIFNASYDTEISLTLSGCLPTAGIAFSKSYRQQHAQFVKQCRQKPLDQNQSSSYLKAFRSDLYSFNGNIADNLFSFIKAKSNLETTLDIMRLTPKRAVEYFINFLQGDYSGSNLQDLSEAFNLEIEKLEASGETGYEFQLYCGIHEILLVAAEEKTPTAEILFSLHKITAYAKQNADQTMSFMAPLLQSKYFRSLFSQVLHYYWLSEESVLNESYVKAFNGQAATESLIELLKSKLSESRTLNDQVSKLLRRVRLLFKLEQELSKSTNVTRYMMTTANRALFYREKAFHLLDWLPSFMGFADNAMTINILLQIGITLQKAVVQEPDPVLRMADEKLAAQIYVTAVGIGHHAMPDVEFYANVHSVKCLLSCHYTDSKFKEILEALQHRALWIADLFPFFQAPQSNADFIAQGDKTLVLMRQLLHALIDKIDDQRDRAEIDHSYVVRVVYQAYEACLRNWFQESHDPEKEKKFRQQIMQELLVSKQWTIDDINYNLNAPWPLTDLDEQGWTCPKSSILSSAKKGEILSYKTICGVEFNYKTGEIDFILDYCEDSESDYNRLLTLFDLNELFQHCLTSAIFSLDPVDPDMPYHPFNQMRFAPSTLYHSQLLHTMLITDYLLKFLTVGHEVQRRDPYELRSLKKIMSSLPDHLKKFIYNFHASNHEESLHRFWIESEEVELAIDTSKDDNILFALGNIRMVVKHHKMKRDAEGNLVDKEGEDEGWDCYILTQAQKQELYNGKRIIPDSALNIIKKSWELIFWENQKATHRFTLKEDKPDLIRLSKLQCDSQGKVKTNDSESLRQIYRVVLKAAEKTDMPHRYSPEFIFAQEFTKHYDEFAIYFPEFGRLRELSKAASLVNVMETQRIANQEQLHLIRRRLNYRQFCGLPSKQPWQVKEHNYWQTTRQELKESDRSFPGQSGAQGLAGSPWPKSDKDAPWLQGDRGLSDQNGTQGLAGSSCTNSPRSKVESKRDMAWTKRDMANKGKIRACGEDSTPGTDGAPGMPGPKQPWQVKEHNYWQTTTQELKELANKCVTKQFKELRSKFSKEKIEEEKQELCNNLRRQIGTLEFTRYSPEIRDICDRYYDSIKSDIVAKHGYSGWNSISHRVRREAIEPQIPKFIADLKANKKAAYHKQLLKLFENELNELSGLEAKTILDKFLEGNDRPLSEHFVCYDRKIIAKNIKEVVYPEHTIDSLDKALNNSQLAISEIVNCEAKKMLKKHEQQLKAQLSGREKLEQSFTNLGFGDDLEEVNLEGTCLWVPASFRHDVEGSHSRTVYGGVSILGRIKECARQKDKEALLRQTSACGKRVQQNRLAGNAVNDFFAKNIIEPLYSIPGFKVEVNHYVPTPHGKRFLDVAVLNEKGEIVKAYEFKIGKSPYHRKQRKKDAWMFKHGKKIRYPVEVRRFQISPRLFYQFRMSDKAEDVPESSFSNVKISKGRAGATRYAR